MPAHPSLAGSLLLAMILASVVADLAGGKTTDAGYALMLVSGLCAWAAAILLIPRVRRSQVILISILLIAGLGLLLFSSARGAGLDWHRVITINTSLLSMIISVGFLKLLAERGFGHDGPLPQGVKAFRGTLFTVAIFGSFINISAPVLVADRLTLNRPLSLFGCALLTRTFSGCSSWSPFFAGMAVVLIYVDGMRLFSVMAMAFPFAVIGLIVIYFIATCFHRREVDEFRGYPLHLSSLWIPAVLAVLVVSLSLLAPGLSILTVIALGSLFLSSIALLWLDGLEKARKALQDFVVHGLPNTANELTLFLAAGVLAVGLERLVSLQLFQLPLTHFDAMTASLLLALMLFIAILGVHPVVQIAGLTPLLLPIQPDPQLLALTYMFAWSLGTCAGPLSGTHLVMQGRYGIPCWKGAVNNWPFVGIMFFVAVAILHASVVF